MPLMGSESLSVKLGERILKESGVSFDRVVYVDFTVDWFNGTEVTIGDTDYPVKVRFTRNEPDTDGVSEYVTAKVYESMSQIIEELEDIEDDLRHGPDV